MDASKPRRAIGPPPKKATASIRATPAPLATLRRNQPGFTDTFLIVLILCLLLAFFNAIVSDLIPLGHDEVLAVEPAINLFEGRGFTSALTAYQPTNELFVGIPPIWGLIAAAWMRVVGIGLYQLRLLPLVFHAGATVGMWIGAWRFGLLRRIGTSIAFVAMMYGAATLCMVYRAARYDTLVMFLVAGLFALATITNIRLRLALLVLVSSALGWTAITSVTWCASLAAIIFLLSGWRWIREIIAVGIGSALGLGTYLGCVASLHLWTPFWKNIVLGSEGATSGFLFRMMQLESSIRIDPSSTVLGFIAIVMLIWGGHQPIVRRLSGGAILFGTLLPACMLVVGHYPAYYAWMKLMPQIICVAAAAERFRPSKAPRLARAIAYAAMWFASLGLPVRVSGLLTKAQERDYAPVAEFVRKHLRSEDHVMASPFVYFAARNQTAEMFMANHVQAMSEQEKQRVTVLILDPNPDELPSGFWYFMGGQWEQAASFEFVSTMASRQRRLSYSRMIIYRRAPEAVPR